MAVDKNLKEKIDSIPSTQPKGLKLGGCARCREYGKLTRVPWEDPYTGESGWGWLCRECIEKSESVKRLAKKFYGVRFGDTPDLSKSFNPVPKPKKKDRKKLDK